ncbi:cytochrome-c oxidase [Sulfitobacter sp. BDSS02]|nr:cytochrome-c oxidase [Sulfitobacter sp. BDSS02]MBR9852214.1 cytochrome-c oxidase [Paracoccaceae bacterium]
MSEGKRKYKLAESEDLGRGEELRRYLLGAAWTLLLTLVSFAVVAFGGFERATTLITVSVLALAQIAAHFRFFLHIDLWRSHRDDLMLILFTALIILLMVGGTTWILFDQWSRMM